MRAEIRETRETIADLAREVADLDGRLAPGNAERTRIEDEIRSTHTHGVDSRDRRVVVLDFARASDRRPLFAALDANAVAWGPMRNRRKDAHRQIKDLERQVERLLRDLERLAKRKRRAS